MLALIGIALALQVLGASCTPTNGVEEKLAELKRRGAPYLATAPHNYQTRYVYDPILEALIMDTAAYVTRTSEYLLNFQQSSASLRRNVGSDVPDYHAGRVSGLWQDLLALLSQHGATEEQLQELGTAMFTQKTWYRMDYHRSEFTRCWTLISQLIEYLNTDYLVPYSTRRPDFLYAAGEEFYYSYMSLASYMSEQGDQAEILSELSEIHAKAFDLGNMLEAPTSELEFITSQLNEIFTKKFSDLNFAVVKFVSAAFDAHSALLGVIQRYNEIMSQ